MKTVDTPDDLPAYMEDAVRKYDDDEQTLAAIETFSRRLREHLQASDDGPTPDEVRAETSDGAVETVKPAQDGGTIVVKKVTCGDDSCKCATGALHGPYVYRVTRNGDSLSWKYLGKQVAETGGEVAGGAVEDDSPPEHAVRDA